MPSDIAAAARAVSRLEPADDCAPLLADPQSRRRIVRALTVAIVGALIIALGANADLVFEAMHEAVNRIAGWDLLSHSRLDSQAYVHGLGVVSQQIGAGILAIGAWMAAAPPRNAARSPLLVSPRRILRVSAPCIMVSAVGGAVAAWLQFFDPTSIDGRFGLGTIWTTARIIDMLGGVVVLPAFLAAILFARALSRAAGARRTEAWFAHMLWLSPLLLFFLRYLTSLVNEFLARFWQVVEAMVPTDPFHLAHSILLITLFVSLRRAVSKAGSVAPLPSISAETECICIRCSYRLDPDAPTTICPECGADRERIRCSPPWARLARRGVTLVITGSLLQLTARTLVAIMDSRGEYYLAGDERFRTVAILFALLNAIGWWCIASRATPPMLDMRERRLRTAARAGIICHALSILAPAVLVFLPPMRMVGFWQFATVLSFADSFGLLLWWWPAAGRTIRATLEIGAPRAARVALAAFWLLPALAWSTGAVPTMSDSTNLWANLVGAVELMTTGSEFLSSGQESMPTPAWWGIHAHIGAASAVACALAYLTYLISLHRAFRRAERRARSAAP